MELSSENKQLGYWKRSKYNLKSVKGLKELAEDLTRPLIAYYNLKSDNTDPEQILKRAYHWVVQPDETEWWAASILEFPGCYSQGKTAEEAVANLREAALGWLESMLGQKNEIPVNYLMNG